MDSYSPSLDRDEARAQSSFLTRVYAHLVLAVLLFVGLEVWFFKSGFANAVLSAFSGVSWLVVLGGFMLLSWVATMLAAPQVSRGVQYLGFVFYVALQALIFVPLLAAAESVAPGAIASAAQLTIGGFFLLTAVVVLTGKDFSFLRTFLIWLGFFGLAAIVCSVLFKPAGCMVFRRHGGPGFRIGAFHDIRDSAGRLFPELRRRGSHPAVCRHRPDVLVCPATCCGQPPLIRRKFGNIPFREPSHPPPKRGA